MHYHLAMKTIKIDPTKIIHTFLRDPQEAIAEATGLSRPTVSAWLRGDLKAVDLRVLAVWCDACDASPADFIKLEEVQDES